MACSFISDEMEQGGPDSEAISPRNQNPVTP